MSFPGIAAIIIALFATSVSGSGIDGKWVGALPGREGPRTLYFLFEADGSRLTGEMVDSHGDNELVDGKIDGTHLSFTIVYKLSQDTVKRFYKGVVVGEQIHLSCEAGNGANHNEFSVTRMP